MGESISRNKGYILKFYKKIKNEVGMNRNFDFVSFMNFDGIKIIEVNEFKDFQQKSINYSNPCMEDENCFRQKLLLYSLSEQYNNLCPKDSIFSRDTDFGKSMPILVIAIVNLNVPINFHDTDFGKLLLKIKKNATNKIKFEIFGTFSMNDFVMAIRCNSFSDFFDFTYNGWFNEVDILHSVYTIPSIYLGENINLGKEKNILFSMRSALSSNKTSLNKNDLIEIDNTSLRGISDVTGYFTFGKYDVEIRGDLVESKSFLSNFDDSLDFRFHSYEIPMKPTNTRFLYKLKNKPLNKMFDKFTKKRTNKKNTEYIEKNDFSIEFLERVAEIKDSIKPLVSESVSSKLNTSIDFKQNFMRLWLRAYQLLLRSRYKPTFSEVSKTINTFFKIVSQQINNVSYFESMIYGLKSLNIMIDNWDLNDFQEFENPHSNLMFSGCCTSLLSAYFKMTSQIFSFIQMLNRDEKTTYCSYITADGYSEVSVANVFKNLDGYKMINIRAPMEMLYDFSSTVSFISHELGHYWEYDFEKENIDDLFEQIYNISFLGTPSFTITGDGKEFILEETSNCFISHNVTDKQLLELKYKILLKLNEYICTYSGNYEEMFLSQMNSYVYLLEMFSTACKEAVADIFMIKLLKMDALNYLDVVVEYLKYKNIPLNETTIDKMDDLLIRVISVLLSFDDEHDYNEMDETIKLFLLPLISQYSSQNDVYAKQFCDHLEAFLKAEGNYVNEKTCLSIFISQLILKNAIEQFNLAMSYVPQNVINEIEKIQIDFSKILNTKENQFNNISQFVSYLNSLQ